MTNVNGTIEAPAAPAPVVTHTDPANKTISGNQPSGTTQNYTLTPFTNTGNVPQTCTFNGIENPVNCSQTGFSWYANNGSTSAATVTIQPGALAQLTVSVALQALNPGDANVPFSFSVTPVWAQA